MRLGSPTRSIPLNRLTGELPRTRGRWRVCHCVDGACEEVDWCWDVELVGEEEQEVVLTFSLLLEWLIRWEILFWIWFQLYDFDDLYNFLRSF